MLLKVSQKLFVGNTQGMAFTNKKDWAVIHACQSYHYSLLGWSIHNRPKKEDPNYLIYYKSNSELSLNWVDGGQHLYEWYGANIFSDILNFIDKNIQDKKVLIHCDRGESRSPTLALLYLAKRLKEIPNKSYLTAYSSFIKLYPQYKPGGIASYVDLHWTDIT